MTQMTTKRPPRLGRRTRSVDVAELVRCLRNDAETGLPVVYTASSSNVDPQSWATLNQTEVTALLHEHGVLLFRGFPISNSGEFQDFAGALTKELYGNYGDLPKERENIYHSTPYPEDRMILYHNESSHLTHFPAKQLFFCQQPSPEGGATPIADGIVVAELLGETVIDVLRRKQLRYIRNFLPGLDVSWQDFFKTSNPEEVAQRCALAGMTLEWLDGGGCTVYNQAPAVMDHPIHGQPVFFNQIQLHHPLCLDQQVRGAMEELYGMARFPRNVTFGDGTPIDANLIARINEAYETAAKRFQWHAGDVLMLDNTRWAHARDPFKGPRKIMVAMADLREATA